MSFIVVRQQNSMSSYDYGKDIHNVGNDSVKQMKYGQWNTSLMAPHNYSSASRPTLAMRELSFILRTKHIRQNETLYDNKLYSVCCQNPVSHIILCCHEIQNCDMTAKVGIMEGEDTVIVRQGHDKHVSAVADTDASVKRCVVYAGIRGNGAVDTFPQQRLTSNGTRRGVFCIVGLEAIGRGRAWKRAVRLIGLLRGLAVGISRELEKYFLHSEQPW
jgi:hypothetical protein